MGHSKNCVKEKQRQKMICLLNVPKRFSWFSLYIPFFCCMLCCLSLQVQSKASAPPAPQASPAPPAPSTPPSSSIPPAPPAPPPRRRTPATKFLGFVPRFWIAKRCSANTPELMCRFSKSLPKFPEKRGILTAACIEMSPQCRPSWNPGILSGRKAYGSEWKRTLINCWQKKDPNMRSTLRWRKAWSLEPWRPNLGACFFLQKFIILESIEIV